MLDDLVRAIGGNRLSLRDPCMEGTRRDILQQIETGIKRTDGHNVIWIKGSPGVGKSALAASITSQLQYQKRHVTWFRFDRRVYHDHYKYTVACRRPWSCSMVPLYSSTISAGQYRTELIQHWSPVQDAHRGTIIRTERYFTWRTSGDCDRCIGWMWWSQAWLHRAKGLWGSPAYAPALGSEGPSEEVQSDHYQPTRGPYHPNIPW